MASGNFGDEKARYISDDLIPPWNAVVGMNSFPFHQPKPQIPRNSGGTRSLLDRGGTGEERVSEHHHRASRRVPRGLGRRGAPPPCAPEQVSKALPAPGCPPGPPKPRWEKRDFHVGTLSIITRELLP